MTNFDAQVKRALTEHADMRWRIKRQVNIVWIAVTVALAVFGTSTAWVYSIGNRVTALETQTRDDRLMRSQFQSETQAQLSEISTQLAAITARLPSQSGPSQ